MPTRVTITEARDQLSAHVRSAERGTPMVITRRGQAVAVIVAAKSFEQRERLRGASPQAGLAGLASGWRGSEDLVRVLDAHRRGPPRPSPIAD